jgi:Fur family ferric uptake transcriptional regulator
MDAARQRGPKSRSVGAARHEPLRRGLGAVGRRAVAAPEAGRDAGAELGIDVRPVGDNAPLDVLGDRALIGTLSTQAVYDALRALTAAGLVRRIEPAGSPARFETRVGDNHHHVVCRVCGAAADVDCVVGAAPCLTPSDASGFMVDEAEVPFWGVCPDCQLARAG